MFKRRSLFDSAGHNIWEFWELLHLNGIPQAHACTSQPSWGKTDKCSIILQAWLICAKKWVTLNRINHSLQSFVDSFECFWHGQVEYRKNGKVLGVSGSKARFCLSRKLTLVGSPCNTSANGLFSLGEDRNPFFLTVTFLHPCDYWAYVRTCRMKSPSIFKGTSSNCARRHWWDKKT